MVLFCISLTSFVWLFGEKTMTKFEMGLKMAKISERNLVLEAHLSQAKQVMKLAAGEVERGRSENAQKLLKQYVELK